MVREHGATKTLLSQLKYSVLGYACWRSRSEPKRSVLGYARWHSHSEPKLGPPYHTVGLFVPSTRAWEAPTPELKERA